MLSVLAKDATSHVSGDTTLKATPRHRSESVYKRGRHIGAKHVKRAWHLFGYLVPLSLIQNRPIA